MSTLSAVFRDAWRSLRRHPVYSGFAAATLAAAIGGVTLLFSLWDAIALRKLPVDHPDDLVSVRDLGVDAEGRTADLGRLSLADFEELRDGASGLAGLSAYAAGESLVRVGDRAERTEVQWMDPRGFAVLGVRAALGRIAAPSDDPRRGGAGGVVLTDAGWARFFGRDRSAVGGRVDLDGRSRTVLGVLPPGFAGFAIGAEPALFAVASEVPPAWEAFRVFGRLRSGASRPALESRLTGILAGLRARQPGRERFVIAGGRSSAAKEHLQVADGSRGESDLRGEASLPLALVGGLLGVVLVVLAANLANLLAVRALAERGAAAVRMALGAPRAAIAAAWLAESSLIALSGAALGVVAVAWGGADLLRWAPLPAWAHGLTPALDVRVLALAAGAAVLIALLVGGFAAREQLRVAPALRLREEGPAATLSREALFGRNVLIGAQVALSVVLMVAMGLFVRSAAALLRIDTGFPLERVLAVPVEIPATHAPGGAAELERLRRELGRLPGVEASGFSATPILGGVRGYAMTAIEGYRPRAGEVLMVNTLRVGPGLFAALGLRPASGRLLREEDALGAPRVAVVNRRFARRYFGDGDPIGRRVSFNYRRGDWSRPDERDLAIVGVVDDGIVSDVRDDPAPRLYAPPAADATSAVFYLRTAGSPLPLAPAVERLLRRSAPDAAIGSPRSLAEQRDRSLRRELLTRDLTLLFGTLAAGLSALGLFAVLSYVIGERRREFGLRQALGATPRDLIAGVLGDGLRPVAAGLAAGAAIAAAASRVAASQLYGIGPRDPLAFAGAAAAMALVGFAACLPPALRASRTDPGDALRGR